MNSHNLEKKRILFFDSGCGGLSIYANVMAINPELEPYYVFDNEFFPYSTKEENFISKRVDYICEKMHRKYNFDVIVIACNTASTIALPYLRDRIQVPIVGVVPAIKPAAKLSKKKNISLLATAGTIKRSYTHELIKEFASDCKVQLIGTTELVQIAEQKMQGFKVDTDGIKDVLKPYLKQSYDDRADVMVLGCTHFPLLKDEIQKIVGDNCQLIDSGLAIGRRVKYILNNQKRLNEIKTCSADTHDEISVVPENNILYAGKAFYTGQLLNENKYAKCFANFNFDQLYKLN